MMLGLVQAVQDGNRQRLFGSCERLEAFGNVFKQLICVYRSVSRLSFVVRRYSRNQFDKVHK